MAPGSILCPVDFSDESQHALRWAAALAKMYEGRLIVMTAVEPLLAQAARTRFDLDLAKTETEPALRKFVADIVPTKTPTEIEVRVGNPPDAILDAADKKGLRLIVMGTHGLGGLRKVLLGSTTERVLRRTPIPVLAVPLSAAGPLVDVPDPPTRLKTILAATDFSDRSLDALRWAGELAIKASVPLLVAHVLPPVAVSHQWRRFAEGLDDERVAEARARVQKQLTVVPRHAQSETIVTVGTPAESITTIAEERGAGMIVLGLIGDQGILAPRPGSVAYKVLTLSRVPVAVVPPSSDARE
jgi:nucleotide-binding universal stress UspA family protein